MKILIVDDEKIIADNIIEYFRKTDYEFDYADNGEKGYDKVKNNKYDVIVSDIKMPKMTGIELLENVTKLKTEIYVVLMTGYEDMSSAILAVKHGAYDYLRKPFKLIELRQIIYRIENEIKLKLHLEEVEQELIKSRKQAAVNNLLSGVMHEINNPNTFIFGNIKFLIKKVLPVLEKPEISELLKQETKLEYDDIKDTFEGILKGSNRIMNIVDRTKLIKKTKTYEYSEINLKTVLVKVFKTVDNFDSEKIKLNYDFEDETIKIKIQEIELIEILSNIISNSVESFNKINKPKIIIKSYYEDDYLVFIIKDNGPGIPEKNIEYLTDPFFTTKGDKPGRGLGLYMVNKIIVENKGTFEIKSELNKRTENIIKIPLIK